MRHGGVAFECDRRRGSAGPTVSLWWNELEGWRRVVGWRYHLVTVFYALSETAEQNRACMTRQSNRQQEQSKPFAPPVMARLARPTANSWLTVATKPQLLNRQILQ